MPLVCSGSEFCYTLGGSGCHREIFGSREAVACGPKLSRYVGLERNQTLHFDPRGAFGSFRKDDVLSVLERLVSTLSLSENARMARGRLQRTHEF